MSPSFIPGVRPCSIIRMSIASRQAAGCRSMVRDGSVVGAGFFLPIRVLSRLFRRLFLDALRAAFAAGDLGFFGALAELTKPGAFNCRLRELRRLECRVDGDVAVPIPHRPGRAGFPASGSSRERFAHGGVSMEDLGWRQRMAFQDFVEAGPSDDALAISPRQPFLPYPHHLVGEPSQSSTVAANAVVGEVAPHH